MLKWIKRLFRRQRSTGIPLPSNTSGLMLREVLNRSPAFTHLGALNAFYAKPLPIPGNNVRSVILTRWYPKTPERIAFEELYAVDPWAATWGDA